MAYVTFKIAVSLTTWVDEEEMKEEADDIEDTLVGAILSVHGPYVTDVSAKTTEMQEWEELVK